MRMPNTSEAVLSEQRRSLIYQSIDRQFSRHPELEERFGPVGRLKCTDDAGHHLDYLRQAVEVRDASLFVNYVTWVANVLQERGVPSTDLSRFLGYLSEVVSEQIPTATDAAGILQAGIEALEHPISPPASHLSGEAATAELAQKYLDALLRGDRRQAMELVRLALEADMPIRDLYLDVFQPVQRGVGRLWESASISVAQEHFCTAVTQLAMSQVYSRLFDGERHGRVAVVSCVAGNLHELGARMVADLLEVDGWDTHYLGANTPTQDLVDEVARRRADVVGISVTLATQLEGARTVIDALRADGRTCTVPILVGGRPFIDSPELLKTLGADGTATDAGLVSQVAEGLLG